jgi:YesN/AraC family two-component response regulator
MIIIFILYRPKFLDDDRYANSFNRLLVKSKGILFKDFEFLFYFNHYYLNPKASLDDFALKLNHSKEEVVDFLKNEMDENFTDLLNQNRIEYFKELLKAKKYESFTIEALSEMSGFGTRRTMYSAFNKFVGMTPSDYINTLK